VKRGRDEIKIKEAGCIGRGLERGPRFTEKKKGLLSGSLPDERKINKRHKKKNPIFNHCWNPPNSCERKPGRMFKRSVVAYVLFMRNEGEGEKRFRKKETRAATQGGE